MLKELHSDFETYLNVPDVVVIDFWAEWCQPCLLIRPRLEKLSEEYSDVKFYSIDVDKHRDFSDTYNIRAIPTLLLMKNGDVFKTIKGTNEAVSLKKDIDDLRNK